LRDIERIFAQKNHNLFTTFRELDDMNEDARRKPWREMKKLRKQDEKFDLTQVQRTARNWTLANDDNHIERLALLEMATARRMRPFLRTGRLSPDQREELMNQEQELLDQENFRIQADFGNIGECACCFNPVPFNRMVHCSKAVPPVHVSTCLNTVIFTQY
jgi:hypothetical protein